MVLGMALAAVVLGANALRSGPRAGHSSSHLANHGRAGDGHSAAAARAGGLDSATPLSSFQFHHPPRAGLLFDLDNGRVLWAFNATTVVPMASLAKMMTALLVVRGAPPDAPVLVTRSAYNTAGSKIGVLPIGRRVPLETLLYGLLLPSGNDAAVALAEHIAGSVPAFVGRMNLEAARLHLGCTHYASPDGLADANRS